MKRAIELPVSVARNIYPDAAPGMRMILEQNFTKEELSGKVTDRVRTYEAACEELGEQPMDEAAFRAFYVDQLTRRNFPQDRIEAEIHSKMCLTKMETITRAWNGGKVADWTNPDQRKYVPWFDASAGFAFYGANCSCSGADAGDASRLCFIGEDADETRERAALAGKLFIDYYKGIIL